MVLKIGDSVFVKNEMFTSYGCTGVVTNIDGKIISVEMKRRNKKFDESEYVTRQYYPTDLKKAS